MPRITSIYEDPGNPALTQFLQRVVEVLNGLDDDNFAAGTTITKASAPTTAHASQHAMTGMDPLPKDSIGPGQLAPRSVGSIHLGIGAVLKEHMGYSGTITGEFYVDEAVLTVPHNSTISSVDGYTKMVPLLLGWKNDTGPTTNNIYKQYYYMFKDGASWKARAEQWTDNGGYYTGELYVVRMAWK